MPTFRSALRTISIFVFSLFALTSLSLAQSTFGSIVGTVTDSSGGTLANATVTVTNDGTGAKRTVMTSDSGDYQVLSLSPGAYTVTVENTGFKRYSRNPVEVLVAQAARIDVTMTVGAVSEQVTVTSQAPLIQSENAALGQVVQGKAVTDIPLNGRNVLALVGLVPGVVPQGSSSGNLTGKNVFAAGNYQIGGGTANQSSTLVDGAPVNISMGNATELVPSQDSVQEFRVQTNNNTAEYGMYTGGVINISTKSGTNHIHGTAYEFLRNTVLNATPYFSKHDPNPSKWLPVAPYHQNQFGGNIGFPIWRDKLFGFFDYQGYRESEGHLFNYTVPTDAMRRGDFSELLDPAKNKTPTYIYDPLTPCGVNGAAACDDKATRARFPGNIIPKERFNTVAKNVIAFPYWAEPTNSNLTQNFVKYGHAGGKNDQYTARLDYTLSDKQRLFGRYTRWNSQNIASDTYGNGLFSGDPISPEAFTTNQIVVGDTYVFNPTTIGDLHVSYLRWNYKRTPGTLGYDATNLGFPSYFSQIPTLNNLTPSTTVPTFTMANPTYNQISSGLISSINNNYVIAPSVSKTIHGHTLKFGADLRRLEMLYFQNNSPGGVFAFNNVFTGKSASAASGTGNPFASFLLGYASSGIVQIAPPTNQTIYYQGYYVSDNWTVNNKLTLTLGLRYEIPGVYRERHNRIATFNPTEVNPVLGAVSINGKPVLGAFDLVGTPLHPALGMRNEHFTNFSPRLGLAYRLDDNTVIRAGWGKFVVPSDLQFPEAPIQSGINYVNNNQVVSTDNNATPATTLDNPFPSGLLGAPGRDPSYQQILLGGTPNAVLQDEENGATYQWNFAIQRQLPKGVALEVAYAGLHGSHLPVSYNINQVSETILNQAASDPNCVGATANLTTKCFLTKKVANPFYGKISQGALQDPTVSQNQLLRPYPQYGSMNNTGSYQGVSNYTALQMKAEKRFSRGGVLLGSYTFSKLMANVETLTSWLDSTGSAGYQNLNDLSKEYSLSSFDSRQRLVVSYVYSLPFGRNQRFFSNVSGFVDKLVSGYGFNGVTTFQEGYPLALTMAQNNISTYALTGNTRPNVVAGCSKKVGGPIQQRLGDSSSKSTYFNTGCFAAPATPFSFGNESRTDNTLRGPGQANFDLALFKDTSLTEKLTLQLRIESFNLFNRVQFSNPNTSIGNSQVGQITNQLNDPRLLQVAGRINF